MSERYIMKKNEIKNVIEKSNIEAETKNIAKRSNKEAEIKNEAEQINNKTTEQKKKFTIMGLSVWRILAYFIIYSVVGYIIETIFGIITKGTWESRQSFLYGPFCAIYGLGAAIMIIFLHKYSKNYTRLFIGGFIVGSIVEYLVSWIGEILLGVKWWDYSNMPLNINGRICLTNLLFFGLMGLVMVYLVNPFLIDILNKIDPILLKCVVSILLVLFIIDFFVSFSVTSKIKNVGKVVLKDSTEEINAKVKEILIAKGKLTRRITKAFPNFNIIIKQKKANE